MFKRRASKTIAMTLAICVLQFSIVSAGLAQQESSAPEERHQDTTSQFGMGAASFFLTIPYGLVKVVYASLGGIVGGFTYALTAGNERAANAVWHTSLRGTYVITPDHLRGDKAVRFFGVPPDTSSTAMAETAIEAAPAPVR
jgi:hypothetical protein